MTPPELAALQAMPDHTQLPCEDDTVNNFHEHYQSVALTTSIQPVLDARHPDGNYCIGQDCGIYWRYDAENPLRGCAAPDWFYVPNVPQAPRRGHAAPYVLWKEVLPPMIVLEYVSDTDGGERDRTPWTGKFWVYENVIRPGYYGIFDVDSAALEVFRLQPDGFHPMPANDRGHFPIAALGVELGIWTGRILNIELPWMRWWDEGGNLLQTGEEAREAERCAEVERMRAEEAEQQMHAERQRAEDIGART